MGVGEGCVVLPKVLDFQIQKLQGDALEVPLLDSKGFLACGNVARQLALCWHCEILPEKPSLLEVMLGLLQHPSLSESLS